MKRDMIQRELRELQQKIGKLEQELAQDDAVDWTQTGYYTTYHFLSGIILGFLGAVSSLVFNTVGSVLVGQHPLQLIRVYLTFPLGLDALKIDSGAILALGCCLYLATGALYGAIIHILLSKYFAGKAKTTRFAAASAMGLGIWLVNFYGILSWAQPMFFGGSWILEMVPFWVAALTHLVFAWTIYLVDEWGYFDIEGHSQKIRSLRPTP
jgi:hypothetical protein